MPRCAGQSQGGDYGQDEEERQRRARCGDGTDGGMRHVPHRIVSSVGWDWIVIGIFVLGLR